MYHEVYTHQPGYAGMLEFVRALRSKQQYVQSFSIGRSTQGREIFAFCFGRPHRAALYVGGAGGCDTAVSSQLLAFIESLITAWQLGESIADIDIRRALESRSLVVIPCLNPDGAEIALRGQGGMADLEQSVRGLWQPDEPWRANARGVEVAYNFPTGFERRRQREDEQGITGPAAACYGGPEPLSEPESGALRQFCLDNRPSKLLVFDGGTDGIAFRYGTTTPQRSRLMAQMLAFLQGGSCVTAEDVLHAHPVAWFIEAFSRPAFLVGVPDTEREQRLKELMALGILI